MAVAPDPGDRRRRVVSLTRAGDRMLNRLEDDATALGHTVVRLDTNATLTDAITLYERNGYRSIERYNDNPYAERWFEKDVRSR